MPKVLNKRTDKIPADAVYVGRPAPWGNQYRIGRDGTREQVIERYRLFLLAIKPEYLAAHLAPLRGKDLVCWCHTWDGEGENPRYCHADILLELANK